MASTNLTHTCSCFSDWLVPNFIMEISVAISCVGIYSRRHIWLVLSVWQVEHDDKPLDVVVGVENNLRFANFKTKLSPQHRRDVICHFAPIYEKGMKEFCVFECEHSEYRILIFGLWTVLTKR